MARQDIRTLFETRARSGDGAFAIAWALMDLADAQETTAKALFALGNGNASTHVGAIENLAMQLDKGSQLVAEALAVIANAKAG